jgi:hypothetical protein
LKWLLIVFTPQADCGDYVTVTNAQAVKVTGRKAEQILYRYHTGYPGGLKEIEYKTMQQKKPDEVSIRIPLDAETLKCNEFAILGHPSSRFGYAAKEQTAR